MSATPVPNSAGTSTPRFKAPRDRADCHIHIYDPRFPMACHTNPEGLVNFGRDHPRPSFSDSAEYPYFSADEIKKALKIKAGLADMLDQMQ